MKRIALLLLTNLAIMLVLSLVTQVLGVQRWMAGHGLNAGALLMFCLVFGMGGAFISLLFSKPLAKWSTGAQVLDGSEGPGERWLIESVRRFADAAGIAMPEVALYDAAEPNAFATGFSKHQGLVAVSTGLLQTMRREEIAAVLGHEVHHLSSDDCTTLVLLTGCLNTFTLFLARVVGYAVDRVILRNEETRSGVGYLVTVFILDLLLGVLASMLVAAFSRQREFAADAGAAHMMGSPTAMINALSALANHHESSAGLPQGLQAFGIAGGRLSALFATHPPLEDRIAALRQLNCS